MVSTSSCSSPWLTLPPTFPEEEGGDTTYNLYSLADDKVLRFPGQVKRGKYDLRSHKSDVVGSSHGWLVHLNQNRGVLFLSNPISRRLIELPPIHFLPDPETQSRYSQFRISKLVLSSSPDDKDCRAMISFGPGDRLAFCSPRTSMEWIPIGISDVTPSVRCYRRYQDFVPLPNSHHLFTSVTDLYLDVWDVKEPRSPRLAMIGSTDDEDTYPWPDRSEEDTELKSSCVQLKYLVLFSDDQLFLVVRHVVERMVPDGSPIKTGYYCDYDPDPDNKDYPYKTIGFDVYRVDRKDGLAGKWNLSYMDGCLDGLAMFVGTNHSFALPAVEFPELKPDAIYFADDPEFTPPSCLERSYGGHDVGIFDYRNSTISPCCGYPCDYRSIQRIDPPPMWFTPSPTQLSK
ncbi:hypothetical protein PHJA_002798900 [Phtheirospermum japonicum]|uniref:KIB1-4 beta-propeller domain-containing protein n=1 Tax=Phtheirospermum japonicum TaxID=374723 RepID=A0A830D9V5_9LAMI|nr:hypothetical protein PHJA_002798900 [Phtheirospermum japonicum]